MRVRFYIKPMRKIWITHCFIGKVGIIGYKLEIPTAGMPRSVVCNWEISNDSLVGLSRATFWVFIEPRLNDLTNYTSASHYEICHVVLHVYWGAVKRLE